MIKKRIVISLVPSFSLCGMQQVSDHLVKIFMSVPNVELTKFSPRESYINIKASLDHSFYHLPSCLPACLLAYLLPTFIYSLIMLTHLPPVLHVLLFINTVKNFEDIWLACIDKQFTLTFLTVKKHVFHFLLLMLYIQISEDIWLLYTWVDIDRPFISSCIPSRQHTFH